ncbi:MAG: ATP-dependent DNA helicase RecG, partial [Micrococcales bacterium]|nr:ATP-dependent DNA helicase RecG [Micrococcales bacterium]
MLLPQTPLDRLLGDKTAKSLAKNLGLVTVSDLLTHYPRRYAERGELTRITEIPVGENATLIADVVDVSERRMKGKS